MRQFILLLAAGLLLPQMGQAAPDPIANLLCAPQAQMKDKLTNQFRSQRAGKGLRSPEQVMELWHDPKRGDWTLVISYATGVSCIVAMGEYWDMTEPG